MDSLCPTVGYKLVKMKAELEKKYVPVGNFERQTSHCPTYIAWIILDEARDYFRTEISEDYADKFARRVEVVFANNPCWQRRYSGGRGRDYLLMTMRHWLAGVLAMKQPALFRDLPDSFKWGRRLPAWSLAYERPKQVAAPKVAAKKTRAARRAGGFVHGGDLLLP
jgi:hypothetical protein